MEDPLLTVDHLAKWFSAKPQTIRDAAARGEIPCVRLWKGKKKTMLRFRRSEIEEFLQQKSLEAAHGVRK